MGNIKNKGPIIILGIVVVISIGYLWSLFYRIENMENQIDDDVPVSSIGEEPIQNNDLNENETEEVTKDNNIPQDDVFSEIEPDFKNNEEITNERKDQEEDGAVDGIVTNNTEDKPTGNNSIETKPLEQKEAPMINTTTGMFICASFFSFCCTSFFCLILIIVFIRFGLTSEISKDNGAPE